jgi:HlyD family secretion protein
MRQKQKTKDQPISKQEAPSVQSKAVRLATITLALVTSVGTGFTAIYSINQLSKRPSRQTLPSPTQTPAIKAITALGRLEPQGEVIQLSAPTSIQGARIAELMVNQGDLVRPNQVIAVLDNRDRLQAALERSQKQVYVAQANLQKVKAGAKSGVIGAQDATKRRIEAESQGEKKAQQTTIDRLTTQLAETEKVQDAIVKRLEAEQLNTQQAQDAIVRRLELERLSAIQAQDAIVRRQEKEKLNVEKDFERYQQLAQDGAISASALDSRKLSLETAIERTNEAQANRTQTLATLREQINEAKANRDRTLATLNEQINEAKANRNQTLTTLREQLKEAKVNREKTEAVLEAQINEAKANLEQIKEVRPVDIQQAEAEVASAMAAVEQAKADLELAYVKSPTGGRILKIKTRAGETVKEKEGIAELGQTDEMIVVAEVYESDIAKVQLGQQVNVTSESQAFKDELRGTVNQIGLQIGKKDILSTDPAATVDARVVEVNIRLTPEDSKRVAGLTNSKVLVKILL